MAIYDLRMRRKTNLIIYLFKNKYYIILMFNKEYWIDKTNGWSC